MTSKIINIVLLLFISGCSFEILRNNKSIKKTIITACLGCFLILIGIVNVTIFNGADAVVEMLKLQEVYISGKFIIAGYGCLIGLLLSLFTKNNKNV